MDGESAIDRLLANNRAFADATPPESLEGQPSARIAIVACMDARLDVFAALGLARGEAHVLRNAGGIVTEDTLRSLAISQRRLGTREVMLLHHSRCGMRGLDEEALRQEIARDAGAPPDFAIGAFEDTDEDVRESVLRVRRSSYLLHRDSVRGFVYDVDTHLLREVKA